jgi:hypothetical protein
MILINQHCKKAGSNVHIACDMLCASASCYRPLEQSPPYPWELRRRAVSLL